MRDLSTLATDAAWVTSQEGGNMVHDNSPAMTAKGSPPATPVPSQEAQTDPDVTASDHLAVGAVAIPRGHSSGYSPAPATWKVVTDG